MRKIIWTISIVAALFMASCRPTGTLVPATIPASPQSLPTATLDMPSSPMSTPATPTSGIHLTALRGPTCPGPERPGQICTQPYEGEFVVTDRNSTEVARVTTDQNGKATISLGPGEYTLTPQIEGRSPAGGPTIVTVRSGQYAEVSVELDTGIR